MALTKITAGGLADNSVDSDAYVNTSIDAAHLASGVGGSWVKLQSTTASDSSEVDMETGIDSTYDVYMIVGHDIRGSMDNAAFSSRFEISTYKSDAYYSMTCNAVKAGTGTFSNTGTANDADKLRLADAVGNASTECTDFVMYLHEPHGSGQHKGAYGHARFSGTDGYHWSSFFGGTYINSTAAVTGVQFFFDSGNVAAGVFALYGLSK